MKPSPLPMMATLFRMAVVPVIIVLIYWQPSHWSLISCVLFIIASITDWLDGYLARKLDSVTTMGKFMDPIADKVLVSSLLILFIPLKWIDPIAVIILINRDVVIGGIRSISASRGLVIDAGDLGKWKTTVQMIAIPALFLSDFLTFLPFLEIGYYGLWLSVALSVVSGFQYFSAFNKHKI